MQYDTAGYQIFLLHKSGYHPQKNTYTVHSNGEYSY